MLPTPAAGAGPDRDWTGSIEVVAPVAVLYGAGTAADTVAARLDRLGARRVLIATDATVRETESYAVIADAVGKRLAGTFTGTRQHLPRPVVIEAVNLFREVGADIVVSVGGGSCSDAGKAVRLAAALDIKEEGDFDHCPPDALAAAGPRSVPQIAVPTTLAGAEFTQVAGVTDPGTRQKHVLGGPGFAPQVAVLDPALTASTPRDIWELGALKVLSDAVEILTLPELSPALAPLAAHAVSLIAGELDRGALDDPQSRLKLQLATWMETFTLTQSHSSLGLATALRHVCGPGLGAPHAAVGAIFLSHAYRFNGPSIPPERHQAIAQALGLADPGKDGAAVADKLGELTAAQVGGLRDFGVDRERFTQLAEGVAVDSNKTTNPRHITAAEVVALLVAAY